LLKKEEDILRTIAALLKIQTENNYKENTTYSKVILENIFDTLS
jgi:hypothetical protein